MLGFAYGETGKKWVLWLFLAAALFVFVGTIIEIVGLIRYDMHRVRLPDGSKDTYGSLVNFMIQPDWPRRVRDGLITWAVALGLLLWDPGKKLKDENALGFYQVLLTLAFAYFGIFGLGCFFSCVWKGTFVFGNDY